MFRNFVKPFMDRAVAFVALLVLSPIFLLVALLLGAFQGGRIFFTQSRPGKYTKIFKVIKFKTMNDRTGQDGSLLPDAERLTWIGKIVRKTSLDELPQLINILKGDMSFIGPRPLLPEYLPLYNERQRRRHDVLPGITGWAQVHGRNAVDWPRRFEYDVWYVDHQSFWLDLKIIFMTIFKVLRAEGISGEGVVTMEKFKGNN